MAPMAKNGEEAIGSMGTDTPLAVLSDRSPSLFNYFKQLFAQVTNPPLDAIREELVTSMSTALGPERNLLKPEPESCRHDQDPFAHHGQRRSGQAASHLMCPASAPSRLPMAFQAAEGGHGAARRAGQTCSKRASIAIKSGATILILSDRQIDKDYAPIPSLLATSGLHHHLVREGTAHEGDADRRNAVMRAKFITTAS